MSKTICMLLDEEYKRTLEAVSAARVGSDESKWNLEKLNVLSKQRSELYQTEMDRLANEREMRIKEQQIKDGKMDRWIKLGMDGAALLIPLGVSSYWMAKGLKFEETGSFTSRVNQWVSGNFRLFRR